MKRMILRLSAAIVVALALAVSADGAPKKTKRFVPKAQPVKSDLALGFSNISRDQFFATYKRVGILQVEIPAELGDREDARQGLEQALTRYLKLANLDVVSSSTYVAIADRLNHEVGGMYDASTGKLKAEVAKRIVEKARQEFLATERLDGFVLARVVEMSGSLSGPNVYWDDVRDFSAGRARKSGDTWWPVGLDGNLPVLSLHFQVFRTPDRVNFARYGGIQPVTYARNLAGEHATFLQPPAAELLKDPQRLDRAVRVVTLPLVHTPADMALYHYKTEYNAWIDPATLPALPAPEDLTLESSPLLQSRERILQSVRRVALTSVFDSDIQVPQAVREKLLSSIRVELAPLHWEIIDAPRAYEALARQLMAAKLFDPYTGKRNEASMSAGRKAAFGSVDAKPAPDAILWVGVVRTLAMQRLGDALWDGANQNALTMGPVKKIGKLAAHFRFALHSAPGWSSISAASLQVSLIDAADTTLYQSRGGIQLLEKIVSDTVHAEPVELTPAELFQDAARNEQAAHLAFRDLVLTPEALAAELNAPDDK